MTHAERDAEELLAMQRLANVEHQIAQMERGTVFISCPYCLIVTLSGETAECCAEMHNAISAVVHRKVTSRLLNKADAIAQQVH